ncbi:MAG: hypothetical protein U0K68_11910 [Agathobacter sp.]|nr:hypothetical protein [Agathobacter sp.]
MADCKIDNAAVKAAVSDIDGLKTKYKTAGDDFVTDFKAAISTMEGASKDALEKLFTDNYANFVSSEEEGIPAMIAGLSALLEGNRTNFKDADQQIADKINEG